MARLYLAVEGGDIYTISKLLLAGTNPSLDCQGIYPIHLATQLNFINVVKLLLDCSCAHIDLSDSLNKLTPLMFAAMHGYKDMVNLLLSYGANPSVKDTYQMMAFNYAKTPEIEELIKSSIEPHNHKLFKPTKRPNSFALEDEREAKKQRVDISKL